MFIMLSLSLPTCADELEILERKFIESKQSLDCQSLEDIDIVKQHLAAMVDVDKDARKLFIDDINNTKIRKLMKDVDHFHTDHLKAILAVHEWISISKFGKEADHQAWLLVQHADHDPEFQANCLSTLEKLWPLKETNSNNYAYLYDRVASKRDLRQRYGTQALIKGDQLELLPFEGNLKDLNERRYEMGLDPIEEYLKTLKTVYTK